MHSEIDIACMHDAWPPSHHMHIKLMHVDAQLQFVKFNFKYFVQLPT